MNNFTVKQRGLSLIELILSLAVGLILLLTLASVYVTSDNTNKLREANAELDETARQVFERLKQDFDLAGYVGVIAPDGSGVRDSLDKIADVGRKDIQDMYGRIIESGNQPKSPIQLISESGLPGSSTSEVSAVVFTNKALKIRYQAVGAANDDTGWGLDCISSDSRDSNNIILNSYTFANGTLSCNGEPIVGSDAGDSTSIPELTYRYLITEPPPDTMPTVTDYEATVFNSQSGMYVTNIVDDKAVAASKLGWNGVVGVEVCMVVAGAPLSGRLSDVAEQQGEIPTCARTGTGSLEADKVRRSGDQRLYRRYIKIFNIPNALYFTS